MRKDALNAVVAAIPNAADFSLSFFASGFKIINRIKVRNFRNNLVLTPFII
jgi:hypothetical protein